jgi:hypothetical protein
MARGLLLALDILVLSEEHATAMPLFFPRLSLLFIDCCVHSSSVHKLPLFYVKLLLLCFTSRCLMFAQLQRASG